MSEYQHIITAHANIELVPKPGQAPIHTPTMVAEYSFERMRQNIAEHGTTPYGRDGRAYFTQVQGGLISKDYVNRDTVQWGRTPQ